MKIPPSRDQSSLVSWVYRHTPRAYLTISAVWRSLDTRRLVQYKSDIAAWSHRILCVLSCTDGSRSWISKVLIEIAWMTSEIRRCCCGGQKVGREPYPRVFSPFLPNNSVHDTSPSTLPAKPSIPKEKIRKDRTTRWQDFSRKRWQERTWPHALLPQHGGIQIPKTGCVVETNDANIANLKIRAGTISLTNSPRRRLIIQTTKGTPQHTACDYE